MSYQAFLLNRVWVVIDNTTKEQVGDAFPTRQEADRFILELWRGEKPQSSVGESINWESDDPTETLLTILDKPLVELMHAEAA